MADAAAMVDFTQLHALTLEQHGAFHVSQGAAFGLSADALGKYARRHGWPDKGRGVFLAPGAPETFWQHAIVAVLAAGRERVLVARQAATFLHGMSRDEPDTVELLLPFDRPRLDLAGLDLPVSVSVHRSRTLKQSHAGAVGPIPVTSAARTIIDLAAALSIDDLRAVVIDGRQRRIVTLAQIDDVHRRIPRYRGRAKVARILQDLDEQACDSMLEWDFRVEAQARGFQPYPEPFPFRCSDGVTIHIDVAFPEAWVACEMDGFGSHAERRHLTKHHKRQNKAVADGWRPFLVDWTRLKFDSGGLFADLAALLATPIDRPPALPAA